jgi:hypothetical protein
MKIDNPVVRLIVLEEVLQLKVLGHMLELKDLIAYDSDKGSQHLIDIGKLRGRIEAYVEILEYLNLDIDKEK